MQRPILIMLIIFFAGLVITVIGALFRIMHWAGGTAVILLGMVLQAVGVGLLIWKLISTRKKSSNEY
ncbi:MAG TPA: gliding motility protein GldL [Flavobacterium sp.]|nr:gliding motility protein GldL [Flavobacterium sp.]